MAKKTNKTQKAIIPAVNKVPGWMPHPQAESTLNELSCRFTVEAISIAGVDWKLTDSNPGRADKNYHQGVVDEYTVSMQNGDVFPYVIATKVGDKYQILAGVKRTHAAARANRKWVICYLMNPEDATEEMKYLVAIQSNAKEGVRLTSEELTNYALDMMERHGTSVDTVAKLFRLQKNTINIALAIHRTRRRAIIAGFTKILGETLWLKLSRLSNDNVLREFADLCFKYAITVTDATAFANSIKSKGTEAKQLVRVQEIESDLLRIKSAGRSGNPLLKSDERKKFIKYLVTLDNFLNRHKNLTELQMKKDSTDYKDCEAVVKRVIRSLQNAIKK